MPSFDWTSQERPWVSKKPKGQTSLGRSPHAFDKRYKSKRWLMVRQQILMDEPLCLNCKSTGRITPARVIDHIIPVRSGGSFFDLKNLQPLCDSCHNSKSGKESHGIHEHDQENLRGGRGFKHSETNNCGNVGESSVFTGKHSEGES